MTSTNLSRRHFLAGAGAAGLAGLALPSLSPRYAFATPNDPTSGDVVVLVFLRGGADGLSLVPPFSDAGYQSLRGSGTGNDVSIPPPDASDPTNTAIDLGAAAGGHDFGLHPAMTGLAGVWGAGHLAVVHAVGIPPAESAIRSHFEAQGHWDRGSTDLSLSSGWLARHVQSAGLSDTLSAVTLESRLSESLYGDHRAIAMSSVEDFGVSGFWDHSPARQALATLYPEGTIDPLVQQGADTLAAVDLVATADPDQFDQNAGLYPTQGPGAMLGDGLFEVAKLIRAQVGLRVATVDLHEWDHHDNMGPVSGGAMRTWAGGLSQAMTAFHDDLGSLMDEVTVVVVSEFGRTINVNGSNGTDHGRGGAMFVMSPNAVPGIHGDYPSGALGNGPSGDLAVTTDYRTVLAEVLTKRAGNPAIDTVFPGYSHPGDLGVVT